VRSQVRYIDSSISFLGVVVRQNPDVWKRPSKDVANYEDSSILVVTSDIGLVLAESGFLACRLSFPGKSGFAVFAGHVCCISRKSRESVKGEVYD
jgi:hypothetical protein